MQTRALLATLMMSALPLSAAAQVTLPTLEPPDLTRGAPTVRPAPQIRAPLAPRIVSAWAGARRTDDIVGPADGAPAPHQIAMVRLVLDALADAESYTIEGVTSDCGWVEPPQVIQSSGRRISAAQETLSREGAFQASRDAGCRMSVTLRMKRPGLPPEAPITLTSPPMALAGGRTVAIENTGAMASRFGFSYASPAIGTCSGSASGTLPGSPTYAVGLQATTSSDMRFTVRSGPLGTYCHWRSESFVLPPGVVLTELQSRATASDVTTVASARRATCSVRGRGIAAGDEILLRDGSMTLPARASSPGTVLLPIGRLTPDRPEHATVARAGYPPLRAADGTVVLPDLRGPGRYYGSLIAPLRFELACAATVTNDHYAEFTIERMVFFVPDNVQFP